MTKEREHFTQERKVFQNTKNCEECEQEHLHTECKNVFHLK